jgi:hypothetical protein
MWRRPQHPRASGTELAAAGYVRCGDRFGVWRPEAGRGGAEATSRPSEMPPEVVETGGAGGEKERRVAFSVQWRVGAAIGEWRRGPRLRVCFVLS